MIKNKKGSILYISSSSALDGNAGRSAYSSAKSALITQSKVLSRELGVHNIRVNTIQPGAIATEMSKINWDDLENHDIISSREKIQPLHLMGHPYDVGYAALYFASDESKFVTGSSLLVDGGMSASIA